MWFIASLGPRIEPPVLPPYPLPCSAFDRGRTDVGSLPWTRCILWAVESQRTMRARSRYQGWTCVDSRKPCGRNGTLPLTDIRSGLIITNCTGGPFESYVMLFFWKFATDSSPRLTVHLRNAFFWTFYTSLPPIALLECPLCIVTQYTVLTLN